MHGWEVGMCERCACMVGGGRVCDKGMRALCEVGVCVREVCVRVERERVYVREVCVRGWEVGV